MLDNRGYKKVDKAIAIVFHSNLAFKFNLLENVKLYYKKIQRIKKTKKF